MVTQGEALTTLERCEHSGKWTARGKAIRRVVIDGRELDVVAHQPGPSGLEGYCVDPDTGEVVSPFTLPLDGDDMEAAILAADEADITGRTAAPTAAPADPLDALRQRITRQDQVIDVLIGTINDLMARVEAMEGRGKEADGIAFQEAFVRSEMRDGQTFEERHSELVAEWSELESRRPYIPDRLRPRHALLGDNLYSFKG